MPLASLVSRVSGPERVNMMATTEQYFSLDMTTSSNNYSKETVCSFPSKQTVIHYLHEMLDNNTVAEVARDFFLLFCFGFFFCCVLFYFIGVLVAFSLYSKALGGYFHHVDWLICLCSSSIQCMLPLPGV